MGNWLGRALLAGPVLSALILAAFVLPVLAQDAPRLILPADCDPGRDCFLQNYVDHDPGPAAQDYTCNGLSYDGHKGTDLALPDLAAMRAGVTVIAAAPGTVRRVRDGMDDKRYTKDMAGALDGRDCGNGVVVAHGAGWETQYCHLRKGSITVAPGTHVAQGDPLGQIGLSGRTQFPHVHMSLRHNGQVVDPFAPDGGTDCAAAPRTTLWTSPPAYRPGGLIGAGFSVGVPDFDAIRDGTAAQATLRATAPSLVAWGFAFGGRAGDELHVAIRGPEGFRFDRTMTLERAQAQLFRAAGKLAPASGWPEGIYTARIELRRDGAVLDSRDSRVTVE